MDPKTILFIAEGVTLAHVGRPLALAQALQKMQQNDAGSTGDSPRYKIEFACADSYEFCFKDSGITRRHLHSISSAQFLAALAAGKPVYTVSTLSSYVSEDLRLLEEIRPDVVIGDFRLSLSVSARVAKIPYIALSNAYWSPHVAQTYTVPSLPITRLLPIPLANTLFRTVRPFAFASHTVPLNQIRRRYGLKTLGGDLRRTYTDADRTAYTDAVELFPPTDMPPHHSYLGPVIWSPPVPKPDWWRNLPDDKPIIYVTLGSSGQGKLLATALEALAPLPVTLIAATAGTIAVESISREAANIYVAPFLPGEAAARRSKLVITNGGSPTSQQALASGVPVLGLAGNLDQYLNMAGIVAARAGKLLRADRMDQPGLQGQQNQRELRDTVKAMLADESLRAAAGATAQIFAQYQPAERLSELIEQLTGPASPAS
jgi:UDP:flavonoid glycosyltransferase YjiC (YdhE family)